VKLAQLTIPYEAVSSMLGLPADFSITNLMIDPLHRTVLLILTGDSLDPRYECEPGQEPLSFQAPQCGRVPVFSLHRNYKDLPPEALHPVLEKVGGWIQDERHRLLAGS